MNKVYDELENCVSRGDYVVSLIGGLAGALITLTLVTTAVVWIGNWSRIIGLLLCIPVVGGSVITVIEVVAAIAFCKVSRGGSAGKAAKGVLFLKAAELVMWVGSLTFLFRFFFK